MQKKENVRQVIGLKSGAERWTEGSAFDKMVSAFKKNVGDDPEAYQKIRQLAYGDKEVIPTELQGRFDRKKLTTTQKWGMRLVQLAAQEVVLEREGERAFPDQMGIGTKIGPEADRLIDGINLFYDGHPTFVIDPDTGMKLQMHKVDDIIALLPSKKVFVGMGMAGLLSLVLAACGGQEKGASTATQVHGDTGARSTETVPALATTASTEVPPTATTEATATSGATATAEATATPTEVPASGVAETLGLPEGEYSYQDIKGIQHLVDKEGNLVGVYSERGKEWVNLLEMRDKMVAWVKQREGVSADKTIFKWPTGQKYFWAFTVENAEHETKTYTFGENEITPVGVFQFYYVDSEGKLVIISYSDQLYWDNGKEKRLISGPDFGAVYPADISASKINKYYTADGHEKLKPGDIYAISFPIPFSGSTTNSKGYNGSSAGPESNSVVKEVIDMLMEFEGVERPFYIGPGFYYHTPDSKL